MPTSTLRSSAQSSVSQEVANSAYQAHVNPQWVKLLELLQMNARYVECRGEKLQTEDGRTILDFLSGYCVYNIGHNHPTVVEALHQELDRSGPAMLQSHVAETAGELAEVLCRKAGGRLNKAYFCSSGSEGVETAIKFSRAFTKRDGLLAAKAAFHGLSCGALSLMDHGFWSDGFGPLLPDVDFVDFGDLDALEQKLKSKKIAALFLEPIQGEGGIVVPPAGYLEGAQMLCRKFGTLLVIDEVQTGLYRTGTFLCSQQYGLDPDMVILAKALSGGLVPSGAVLMTDEIYDSVYGSLRRAIVHTSTYSENTLAMRAGLATLQVLDDEQLGARATALGDQFRARLKEALANYEMVSGVRGAGFMSGIVFAAPKSLTLRVSFEAFTRIHPAMFGQMLVMRLYREHGILTQICGNNFLVLKAAPPLNASEESMDAFVTAITSVMDAVHSSFHFWKDALALAGRAAKI
jgi:ornithine--oxo-acid transaminase